MKPAVSDDRDPPRRRCAFCDAPYSDAMTAWFGSPTPCACCDGAIFGHWPIALKPKTETPPRPTGDLACEACGKVLYLAPKD